MILLTMLRATYTILMLLLFARAIMSWIIRDYNHPVVNAIMTITEPVLMPMRNLFEQLGLAGMMFDLSFLATIFALEFLYRAAYSVLYSIFITY